MSEKTTGKMKRAMFSLGCELVKRRQTQPCIQTRLAVIIEWKSGDVESFRNALNEEIKINHADLIENHNRNSFDTNIGWLDFAVVYLTKLEDLSDE